MNLNNSEQEIPEVQFEEYALKLNAGDSASRPKAKAKPQRTRFCKLIHKNHTFWERTRTDVETGKYSFSDYFETMMQRLYSGELKIIFRNIHRIVLIGLTTGGRKAWQEEEETRKVTSTVLIRQE